MYITKEKTMKKLNIKEPELLLWKSLGHIAYYEPEDKYNPDSILEKRTMTIGIEKFFNEEKMVEIIDKMKNYSAFKHFLVKELQHGVEYKDTGTERKHREIGMEKGFSQHIADSALASAKGSVNSVKTWYTKTEEQLEEKLKAKKTELKKLQEKIKKTHQKKSKKTGKLLKKKLVILKEGEVKEEIKYWRVKQLKSSINKIEKKLRKLRKKDYIPIFFGKKHLNDKEAYKKSRLEYFSAGSATLKGNPEIRIERRNDGNGYLLKIFDNYFSIKIPKSHKDTFSLAHYNCQACRICFNKNGKLVLHITYSYIKPVQIVKTVKSKGTVGIDIGPNEIAVCFVKNDGNPEKYIHYSTAHLLDKRTAETERHMSLILDEILNLAMGEGFYNVTIEKLKFKEDNKYRSPKLNRMLKKFPHQMFEDLMDSKCSRRGIKLRKVNPAYTSVIGIYKYSNRDNLATNHNAKSKDLSAALVIGRRGLGFSERAIVCVKVSENKTKTLKISSLYPKSEKEGKKANGKGICNWYLWQRIKSDPRTTFRELTANLFTSP